MLDMSTNETNHEMIEAYSSLKRELNLILTEELKAINFGYKQMLIIHHLNTSPMSMSELSSNCYSDPASTSRTVASLEKAGLVKRKTDGEDNRKSLIQLTSKGRARVELVKQVKKNISVMINQTLDSEEQKNFVQLLNKVISNLKKKGPHL